MFNPDTSVSEFLPFSTHVSPSVVKTTGGDYLVSWQLAGMPFVGREAWEIEHKHAVFNRLLQTLRAPDYSNVAFWVHDVRRRSGDIGNEGQFSDEFNRGLSEIYYDRLSTQHIMQNELYLTMMFRTMPEGRGMREKTSDISRLEAAQKDAIDKLEELSINLEAVLKEYAPRRLAMYEAENGIVFSEVLELFGFLLNRVSEPVPVLNAPVKDYLSVSRLMFSSKTGDFVINTPDNKNKFGAILNVKEYPEGTYPGILNGLKYLEFEYVITHSFSPKGRHEALKTLERTRGMMISSGDKSYTQIEELNVAMDQLASGNFVLGEYHFIITLYADSQEKLTQQIAQARAELANAGFVSSKEDMAVAASFFSQFPGNWRYRTRMANLSSLNFLGLSPLHNFATGKRDKNPWGECITTLQTTNGQPYYFNFHATSPGESSFGEKAIGNTMVIGKSGTGKTALINFLLSQTQKLDPAPTIFFFDKDRGAEIFVRACGGNYLSLESGQPTGFNPFQCENNEPNVQFLSDLIKVLAGKNAYTAREEDDIFRAVGAMLDMPLGLRSMTNFQKSLPNMGDDGLFARLRKWTQGNSLGWVFDNPRDTIDLKRANIIGFDYTDLIDNSEVRIPVINYLIHRLESLIDGRRVIYVMDEFWKILEGEGGLKEFAKNKQKTIRKQNGLGVFATQSPEDALQSDIAAALIEQTATLILLPNPNASRDDYVNGLKLTDAEYEVVVSLDERSRSFLVKQGHASSICQLNLRGMDDQLAVISASTDNIEVLHRVVSAAAKREAVGIDFISPDAWLRDFYDQRKGSGKSSRREADSKLERSRVASDAA